MNVTSTGAQQKFQRSSIANILVIASKTLCKLGIDRKVNYFVTNSSFSVGLSLKFLLNVNLESFKNLIYEHLCRSIDIKRCEKY